MRAVVQRTERADVRVKTEHIGKISGGLLVLLGVGQDDDSRDARYIAEKVTALRIFEDENDKMNLSVKDIGGEVMVISQFTLFGDCRKGRRPSFTSAAVPETAEKLYLEVVQMIKSKGIIVATGQFQADMKVSLVNDGPVTILLDSKKKF